MAGRNVRLVHNWTDWRGKEAKKGKAKFFFQHHSRPLKLCVRRGKTNINPISTCLAKRPRYASFQLRAQTALELCSSHKIRHLSSSLSPQKSREKVQLLNEIFFRVRCHFQRLWLYISLAWTREEKQIRWGSYRIPIRWFFFQLYSSQDFKRKSRFTANRGQ